MKKSNNEIITKELKIDINLLHLQQVIFDLDNYNYDSDIIRLLNELKTLVDKKIYSNLELDLEKHDIYKQELIIKFYLEN